jgi:hypothetical protein
VFVPVAQPLLLYLLENEGEGRSNALSAIFLFSFEKNNAISRLKAKDFLKTNVFSKTDAFVLIGHLNQKKIKRV